MKTLIETTLVCVDWLILTNVAKQLHILIYF